MGNIPWAYLFIFFLSPTAFSAENTAASGIPGAVTYPLGPTAKGTSESAKPTLVVPTPDTIPPPAIGTSTATIPVPTPPVQSLGKYRNSKNEVKLEGLLHDRYKQSVVRVTAKDLAGNVLARAMGVAVGRNAQFIAAPLSLVLGSTQQWADRIEVTHFAGNNYEANVALIDEEKNLVLLSPEASPAPIVFASEFNERPQIDVFTISFETATDGTLSSTLHRGRIAAANSDTGLLSVSPYPGQLIDDAQAGTGLIDSEGKLIGMLLPGGRGVLSSTLQKSIQKAQKAVPIEPRMIGVILGRGVLVDPKLEGAFKTITEALEAIKKGTAPKTDPSRYTPARNRAVAPSGGDKVVIKVMPGTYREKKTISLPSDTSLSGSGPRQTILVAPDAEKPALLVQGSSNVMVAGFRIVPAPLQKLKAPALIISKSSNVTVLGSLIEAKGGVGAWVHESRKISFFGNTFSRGTIRGLSCDKSDLVLETNAFVGDWPMALSLDKECSGVVKRNLFFENKNSVAIASNAGTIEMLSNTFVRSPSAVKIAGNVDKFSLQDNLFYECRYGFYSASELNFRSLGRNAAWKSIFTVRARALTALDIVRAEPVFDDPANFNFRVKPGKAHTGSSLREPGTDLGAFQQTDFLGPHSGPLARSLGAAIGEEDLAGTWGLAD